MNYTVAMRTAPRKEREAAGWLAGWAARERWWKLSRASWGGREMPAGISTLEPATSLSLLFCSLYLLKSSNKFLSYTCWQVYVYAPGQIVANTLQ